MNRGTYLGRQRWFAGTESEAAVQQVERLPWIVEPHDGFGVRFELVHVENGGRTQIYNMPASYREEPVDGLESALMAVEDGYFVYDAMHDADARTALLSGLFVGDVGGVSYHADTGLTIDAESPTVMLVAEQSNSSVIVGDTLLWKLFRIVGHGRNPDIEIGRELTSSGSTDIAPIRAWISMSDMDLAMLYDYYPSATDGWDSARASFRDLLAEPDLDPAETGGDFAAESERLGVTVASVHNQMTELGTGVWTGDDLAALTARLNERFAEAVSIVPELDRWSDAARSAYDELSRLSSVPIQRIHGDLHLGQTLRTVDGWKVFDFEGEPAKPMAARTKSDSVLRDVAAMLRSFDYAPRSVLMQVGDESDEAMARAAEWSSRNSEAFLHGYGIGENVADYVLLRSYQIDKAAYEVAYETHHRPGWVGIPLSALARLLDG